ncbi:MAG: sugar O-acetyltransferase [Anaeromyxobacteraceae bacterium]
MTEREKMLSGQLYLASDPELVAARVRARRLARQLADTDPEDVEGRLSILRGLLGAVGAGAWIEPPLFVDYGAQVHLGARAYLNTGCVLLDCARIDIGDDAFLGPAVQIYTATHPVDPDERVKGPELARPVRIGAKAWIGGAAVILPGVTVGEGATVGAGSVVTRDVPARCVAAGNPCRVLRRLP